MTRSLAMIAIPYFFEAGAVSGMKLTIDIFYLYRLDAPTFWQSAEYRSPIKFARSRGNMAPMNGSEAIGTVEFTKNSQDQSRGRRAAGGEAMLVASGLPRIKAKIVAREDFRGF